MTKNDGTCPDPMWNEKDEAIGWAMFGVGAFIITIGFIACLVELWSKR